jgi:beta-galactosidase
LVLVRDPEWGTKHETRSPKLDANVLDQLLAHGASVNMYMFHGGTNFGFLNGAEGGPYMPLVTSYDYDAPLSEAGDPTEKYLLIRNVIAKYTQVPDPVPQPSVKKAYGVVPLNFIGSLFDPRIYSIVSRKPVKSSYPKTMEQLGENFGFVFYTAKLAFPPNEPLDLSLPTLHDSAQIWLDGNYQGSLLRDKNTTMTLSLPSTGSVLDILVENLGRINFGAEMINEYKGLQSAQLERVFISNWKSTAIPLDDADVLRVANLTASETPRDPSSAQPTFYVGYFNTPAPVADTFLDTSSWTKGVVWINGFNLGRYWCVGPQATLYVPAPVLRSDRPNQVILFDVYGSQPGGSLEVVFKSAPQLASRWC